MINKKVINNLSILHIDYDDLNNSFGAGGQAVVTQGMYKNLKNNFKVTVLTGNYPGAKNNELIDGLNYKRIGIGFMGPIVSLLSFQALIPFVIWKMQKKYDVIVEFFTAPFSSSFGYLTVKKPYLVMQTFFGAKALSKKYHLPFYMVENYVLKHIKNFLAPTREVEKRIRKINPSANVNIVPYGYDSNLHKIKIKENNYVLFLGRIDIYNKGLDTLLQAWVKISKLYPNIYLYIAGRGKKSDEIKLLKIINSLKLNKSLILLGRVTGKKKIRLLANCLFTVVPSRFETFCLSALEALAVGKPLVTSDIQGLSWISDKCTLKFKSGNIQSLVDSCKQLIKAPAKRKELSHSSKIFSKEYSWNKISQKYKTIILQIAGESITQ